MTWEINLESAGLKMKTFSFILGLLLTTALVSLAEAGSTGNSLVTCAACQAAQVKFDSWDCNMNCDVISSENGEFFKAKLETINFIDFVLKFWDTSPILDFCLHVA